MITLYGWNTSNGRKISIALEEMGLDYRYAPVDITRGEQHTPAFRNLNPNGKIPAIHDSDGPDGEEITLFESGAILIYLAQKADSVLYPDEPRRQYDVLQWLMFQMGGIGPSFGQALHFYHYAEQTNQYSIDRYMGELHRLFGVMESQLENRDYFAGEYSIADIAIFPWIARHEWYDLDWSSYPNVKRWFDRVAQRPSVKRGLEVLDVDIPQPITALGN